MNTKKIIALLLGLTMVASLAACGEKSADSQPTATPDAAKQAETVSAEETPAAPETSEETETPETYEGTVIVLQGDKATMDGEAVAEYDYTWHCDPTVSHDEVSSAPAEYYTGTKPETDAAAYIDHELYYYPELPEEDFRLVNYDGENEWAYYYTDGEHEDYIFATLPNLGGFPADMMHSEAEAAGNKVLHITRPGTYILEGQWDGQILVDLGDKDDTFTDENAKVTLVLNGVDVNCTVAPGVLFSSAYECDNGWEDAETHSEDVSTEDAGVTVVIADGTENTVSGENVFRMLKTKYKNEDSTEEIKLQKKMRKTDAAFYSCVTMNVEGGKNDSGTLTVNSGFEGLDSELHLNVSGGNIVINSQDDGINVNEDNVSVAKFTGGTVTLNAALGAEGDGVDSNGFIVIDGGTLSINGIRVPDSPLDSEDGAYYLSGRVIVDGEEQNYTPGDVIRETMMGGPGGAGGFGGGQNGNPGQMPNGDPGQMKFGGDFDIREFKEKVAALGDDATMEDVMALLGGGQSGQGGQTPPDFQQDPQR